SLKEVVELYGQSGFDAIAITDHLLDSRSLLKEKEKYGKHSSIEPDRYADYRRELRDAAHYAMETYNMLLLPGIELTNDTRKFHILAIDNTDALNPDLEVEDILQDIRNQGGISVACHPAVRNHSGAAPSEYLWSNMDRFSTMFDSWEVANRDDLFNSIGLKKFPYLANSDFHEERHFSSWKTLLRCTKNIEAVKEAIRKNDAVSIFLHRGGCIK
ncbi:MAG: phosphotransferase, partial [Chlorobiaceae bacterium]|nr:phosphotransferase [Chlorobiaceae bacterium]